MSYVYIRSEPQLWTVGFYRPDGAWEPESDHGSQDEAAERVAWLNGSDEDLRRDVGRDSSMTDQLAEELLLQIVALEEIVAASWPRSILVRARLRRDLRRSVAHVQGRTFTDRRINTLGTGWLERRP
jgi:hypothetical protein